MNKYKTIKIQNSESFAEKKGNSPLNYFLLKKSYEIKKMLMLLQPEFHSQQERHFQ